MLSTIISIILLPIRVLEHLISLTVQLIIKEYLKSLHITYLLTPWSRVLLENLTGFQLENKFSAFYGNRRFITTFTSARHLFLSWTSSIQSIYPHPTSWKSILILSPSTPGSPKWSLSLRFPHQNSVPYYSRNPLIQINWDGTMNQLILNKVNSLETCSYEIVLSKNWKHETWNMS